MNEDGHRIYGMGNVGGVLFKYLFTRTLGYLGVNLREVREDDRDTQIRGLNDDPNTGSKRQNADYRPWTL